uniref:Uncharacterized protein n=1 Tax=Zea mays TaxID=4577 RepID=B7ZZG6_MAIZE|nr:unknown [Zea mays]
MLMNIEPCCTAGRSASRGRWRQRWASWSASHRPCGGGGSRGTCLGRPCSRPPRTTGTVPRRRRRAASAGASSGWRTELRLQPPAPSWLCGPPPRSRLARRA